MDTVNDKFLEIGGRGTLTTLATPGKQMSDTSIQLTSPTNWPEGHAVAFSIRRVILGGENAGKEEQGSYTEWIGIINGNSIDNMVLMGGNNQDYAPGQQTQVMIHVSSAWGNRLIQGLLVAHTRDGKLKGDAVREALNISGTIPPDWNPLAVIPTVASSNGQKEYVLNVPADVTNKIQPGTRLRIPRTGTVPTQSGRFNAALFQYATKTSPVGLTATNLIYIEAQIKPGSFTTSPMTVMALVNSGISTGCGIRILSSGQVAAYAGTAGVFDTIESYTSVDPNADEYTHIGVFMNVSANTGTVYINGVPVMAKYVNSGASSIGLTGDLSIGRQGASNTEYFNGNISDVRMFNIQPTDQEVKDRADMTLTTATGLIASYPLNGSWNDVSGKNNHLTASGGAINNSASHAFKQIEFGVATHVGSFASGNTPVTVFTGLRHSIPKETLGELSYSSTRSPFGFAADRNLWQVKSTLRIPEGRSVGLQSTYYQTSFKLEVPRGAWTVGMQANFAAGGSSTAGATSSFSGMASTTGDVVSVGDDWDLFSNHYMYTPNVAVSLAQPVSRERPRLLTERKTYTAYGRVREAAGGYLFNFSPEGTVSTMTAECAYI